MEFISKTVMDSGKGYEIQYDLVTKLVYLITALERMTMIKYKNGEKWPYFEISHMDFLFDNGYWNIMPSPETYVIITVVLVVSCLIACYRPLSRFLSLSIAIYYSYLYYSTQIDSYQHHYLVSCLLWIFAIYSHYFNSEQNKEYVHSVIRASICCQMSWVYFWTIITKLTPSFLSGDYVMLIMCERKFLDAVTNVSTILSIEEKMIWALLAYGVVISEVILCLGWASAIFCKKYNTFTAILGVILHVSITFSRLKIGLFSYYMIVLYILLLGG